MLFLAGLMGLMAVGAVAFVDIGVGDDDDDTFPDDLPPTNGQTISD